MEIDHYGMVATNLFSRCYFVTIHTDSARVFFTVLDLSILYTVIFDREVSTLCINAFGGLLDFDRRKPISK